MARRPIFIPDLSSSQFVKKIMVDFDWFSGYSLTQKRKSIESLHGSAKLLGFSNILEISTKSPSLIGRKLSAFTLQLDIEGKKAPVEAFYQSSKVFSEGGPFTDMLLTPVRNIKKDSRLFNSGKLVKFSLLGYEWDIFPETAFYDWLYINAILQNKEFIQSILNYQAFTDIEFNPQKSISCQAYSAALFVSLLNRHLIKDGFLDKQKFLSLFLNENQYKQTPLFPQQDL